MTGARVGLWAAVLGAVAIGYEVVWFRVLSTFFDASTYAFTMLLSVFLLGLALGGGIGVRMLRQGLPPERMLADVQAGLAWTALLAFLALGLSRGMSQGLKQIVTSWFLQMAIHSTVVMLVPAALVGMSFPLLLQLATRAQQAGADVGRTYALNTLGGITASLVFGFLLIPSIGTQASNALLCATSALLALFLAWGDPRRRRLLGLSVAAMLGSLAMVPRDFFIYAQVGSPDSVLLEAREGRDGILSALEYTRRSVCESGLYRCPKECPDFNHRRLVFGSTSYASTTMPARRYMRMEGHLPMLFARQPRKALQVCFGTGTTAGALAAWPHLEQATVVDLNPDVIAFAHHFAEVNNGVLTDPRFSVIFDDGRHFLLSTAERFDVVSFEPPPPRAQGVVNLYSQEFYALVKAHLTEGGVVAQWLPMDQQSLELNRELVAAVLAEFPHAALFVPSRFHGVLLASEAPLQVDISRWRDMMKTPGLAESFEDVGFASAEDVLATFVASEKGLRRLVAGAPPVTDDRPSIEFFWSSSDRAITAADLEAIAEPPTFDVGAKLLAQRRLVFSTQMQNEGRYAEARHAVEEAESIAGGNVWTRYLHDVTYGCLEPRAVTADPGE